MKKQILFILSLLLPLMAHADKVQIDGIYYNLNTDIKTAEVTSSPYGNYTGSIVIPQSVVYGGSTYHVTSIGSSAFSDCRGLTSVTIPGSTSIISSYAFKNCTSLSSITIPGNVKEIWDFAFDGCTSLTSVIMEEGVKMIYETVFRNNNNLTSISFPNSLEYMGSNSGLENTPWYSNQTGDVIYAGPICYKYKGPYNYNGFEITIKEGTKGIAAFAFSNCRNLTSVVLPDGLTTIAEWAFADCI